MPTRGRVCGKPTAKTTRPPRPTGTPGGAACESFGRSEGAAGAVACPGGARSCRFDPPAGSGTMRAAGIVASRQRGSARLMGHYTVSRSPEAPLPLVCPCRRELRPPLQRAGVHLLGLTTLLIQLLLGQPGLAEPAAEPLRELRIAAGPKGGSYSQVARRLAERLRTTWLGPVVVVDDLDGSLDNLCELYGGGAAFAIAQADVLAASLARARLGGPPCQGRSGAERVRRVVLRRAECGSRSPGARAPSTRARPGARGRPQQLRRRYDDAGARKGCGRRRGESPLRPPR